MRGVLQETGKKKLNWHRLKISFHKIQENTEEKMLRTCPNLFQARTVKSNATDDKLNLQEKQEGC